MTDLRRPFIALAALVCIAASGCAIPADSRPSTVAIDPEFEDLLEPAPTTEPTPTTQEENLRRVDLYFIVDDTLTASPTNMSISRAQQLTVVLNELVAGTRLENHRNAIPSGVEVLTTRIDAERRIATIVLSDNTLLTAVEGNERSRAIAQLVFTATHPGNRFGVDRVQFEIDGNIRSVPRTLGLSDTSDPVGRCDYEGVWSGTPLDCPGSTTTTTTAVPPQNGDPLSDVP